MTVRAMLDLGPGPMIKTYTVVAAGSAIEGRPVSLNTSDQEVTLTAAAAACIGIALETKAAGERVQVLVSEGDTIVKVKVGTGGATRGLYGVVVSDGLTNSGTLGGGTVLKNVIGIFMETGVAGDVVGFKFKQFASVSA